MDIPVYSATGDFGRLPVLLREAHEARTRAFHAIAEAGIALNSGNLDAARDAFAELGTLAEDGYRALASYEGARPRGAYEG